ncbi:SRPBCC family protein [Actinopolymorpha sp. B17G11]|uniref:SRPBCC family protein n=1 Tax=Actinopolymorpha sp. B17G11 TaxID=3160861 RepID=UPI0032E48113
MGTQGDRDQAAEVRVTGARTHIDLTIALPQSRVWDLIADVTRIGEWSPECVHGAWLDDGAGQAHAQAQVPAPAQAYARVGVRFAGDNRFANGNVSTVTCVVTQAERPHRFAWVVLDGAEDPDRPGSIWSYELTPGGSADETRVRHLRPRPGRDRSARGRTPTPGTGCGDRRRPARPTAPAHDRDATRDGARLIP